jgi:DDE_Tnp_1-associated
MDMTTLSQSLLDAFVTVPDRRKGIRYSVPSILALTTLAMLSGEDSLFGIRKWGARLDPAILRILGFSQGRVPAYSSLQLIFLSLDEAGYEAALQSWLASTTFLEATSSITSPRRKRHRRRHPGHLPGLELVAPFVYSLDPILAEAGICIQ